MGGLGKTTLAKFVYNDKKVETNFDLKLWVCVSEEFEVPKLVRKILNSATKEFKDKGDMSYDDLQNHLRNELKNKKILLVLDDVWSENRTKWIELKGLLMEGSKGSKVIVTTRKNSVAELMGDIEAYHLEGLCPEDCLSLFVKCAFKDGEGKPNQKLIDIGKQIVEKCKGVPLALTSLGCLLYSELDTQKWISVRDSELWELKEEEVKILAALQLSYNELPSYLKQCFHYFALFPKDHQFANVTLINIWMAHGLLQSHSAMSVGGMYLKELLSRGFFQDVNHHDLDESFYSFYMHDLIHDLAQLMSQNEFSTIKSPTINVSERVQHLSVACSFCEELACLDKLKRVQTMILHTEEQVSVPVSASFIGKYFSKLKFLRVLDLEGYRFEVLPSDIGRMKHLRYLKLSQNDAITELPVSICKLQSLEILHLVGCRNLKVLPEDFNSLISLRMLAITTTAMNLPRMECLTSLRFLLILECPNLISLPINPTLEILVCDKSNFYCEMFTLTENKDNDQVGKLSLRKLILKSLPKMTAFPHWLQGCEDTLKVLSIARCPNLTALPDWLSNMASLEKLVIRNCSELQSLPAEGMHLLTSLQRLQIARCPKLRDSVKAMRKDWLHNINFEHDYYSEDDEEVDPSVSEH